jgi:hypothetical protein
VPGNGAVIGFGGTLVDQHFGGDGAFASLSRPGPRDAERPTGAQTGGQLAPQRTATLNVKCLVDGLV